MFLVWFVCYQSLACPIQMNFRTSWRGMKLFEFCVSILNLYCLLIWSRYCWSSNYGYLFVWISFLRWRVGSNSYSSFMNTAGRLFTETHRAFLHFFSLFKQIVGFSLALVLECQSIWSTQGYLDGSLWSVCLIFTFQYLFWTEWATLQTKMSYTWGEKN
jgi:hypothetical protein